MKGGKGQYIVFSLDRGKFALPLDRVERVVQAAEVTPLSKAPPSVLGLINLKGSILPVFDLRRCFRLPEKETDPGDLFIVARTRSRRVVLRVDGVFGVLEGPEAEVTGPEEIAPGLEQLAGVIRRDDGMILIQDLDGILTREEQRQLASAVRETGGRKAEEAQKDC